MPTLNLGRVGFVNKGTWLISTAYKINDTVTYLGGTYACLIANTGQTPILGGTIYWQEWVANDVVHKSGAETITDVKTFTYSPIVPDATLSGQATNKGQLDLKAPLASPALTGTPTINGNIIRTDYGVRQTVQSASVDTNGFANFLTIGTGLNVNILGTAKPIKINSSGGAISSDITGLISADKVSLLPASSTLYLYESVATDGVCTSGYTTLAPIYQFGGTPSIVNGQFTFNISEMKGYLGNGTTAPQVYITFIGEAVTGVSTVTSVVNYVLNGAYDSGYTNTLPSANTLVSKNHNIGVREVSSCLVLKCLTAELGYAIGDVVYNIAVYSISGQYTKIMMAARSNNAVGFKSGNTTPGFVISQYQTGGETTPTAVNWAYKIIASRGW